MNPHVIIAWFVFGAGAAFLILVGVVSIIPDRSYGQNIGVGVGALLLAAGIIAGLIYVTRDELRAMKKYKKDHEDAKKSAAERTKAVAACSPEERFKRFPYEFMEEAARGRHGFLGAWGEYRITFAPNYRNFIGISGDQKAILVCDKKGHREYALSSLVSCDLVVDESVEQRTERPATLGRAIVGGALFGGAGAVVGALSAGSTTQSTASVKRISLRMYFDDFHNPVADVAFFEREYAAERSKAAKEYELAIKWHARMSSILRRLGQAGAEPTADVKSPTLAPEAPLLAKPKRKPRVKKAASAVQSKAAKAKIERVGADSDSE